MKRIVLDTNAVLDWLHFRSPEFAAVEQIFLSAEAVPITSAACLEELNRVLAYPLFGLDAGAQEELFLSYRLKAWFWDAPAQGGKPVLPQCRDADDQKFLVLANECRADFLVTRDKAVLGVARELGGLGTTVLTPTAFAKVWSGAQVSSARRRGGLPSSAADAEPSVDHSRLR